MRPHYRTHLGPRFTEGARLLWLAIEREGLSIAAAAARLGWIRSSLANVLYGERIPGIDLIVHIERTFDVPPVAWACEPTEPFVPPAAREADEDPATEGAA